MSFSSASHSDKLNIINHSTYTRIQERSNAGTSNDANRRIRNGKYRRQHQDGGFNFLALLAATNMNMKRQKNPYTHHRKGCSLAQGRPTFKKTGKCREEPRKRLSSLKKCVMKSRQKKQERTIIENLSEHVESMDIDEMAVQNPIQKPIKSIHSRNFREYCDNCTTMELTQVCNELLSDLDFFQKRAYEKYPIKANAHRRLVLGFRQVRNQIKINKVKLVIMATDCEKCDVRGGLDNVIDAIKTECQALEIPYVFPMKRRQLAYALKKRGCITCVGIVDYDGAREKFSELIECLQNARAQYAALED